MSDKKSFSLNQIYEDMVNILANGTSSHQIVKNWSRPQTVLIYVAYLNKIVG